MPAGGRIAPDGRPPQAPGVGKTAKRHDLEAPPTPGLHGSDLQQGDVQMLEQAQKTAPIGKRSQPPARRGTPSDAPVRQRQGVEGVGAPDPIQMAAGRRGGQLVADSMQSAPYDPTPWLPLMEQLATAPLSGGTLAAGLVNVLSQLRRRPLQSPSVTIDMDEMDRIFTSGA